MKKQPQLWSKSGIRNESPEAQMVQQLTTLDDHIHDRVLLPWDCVASVAHARGIAQRGFITADEVLKLTESLRKVYHEAMEGLIEIPPEVEDCHSYIEGRLIEMCGDTGKKIHLGRSRNDQVITALRLYLRDVSLRWICRLAELGERFLSRAHASGSTPLPGYTHLQRAMPSSLSLWFSSFAEAFLELIGDGERVYAALDRNPLGAAAGFGTGLGIDRAYTGKQMGFSSVQRNFVDIQNSRGRLEEKLIFWGSQIGGVAEKFAWDVQLFCTQEFGFVSLPDVLTTGSSIMPQKRNPDLVELLRARAASLKGILSELQWSCGKLPSNYHRDLQRIKSPLMRGISELDAIFTSFELILWGLAFDTQKIQTAMTSELFATFAAYEKVSHGAPFRDAYREVANLVEAGGIDPTRYQSFLDALYQEVTEGNEIARAELNGALTRARQKMTANQQQVDSIWS